jgi:hypothetical protein
VNTSSNERVVNEGIRSSPRFWSSLQWWPTLAGIALAAFVAYDLSRGRDLASILAASGLVYLGAAALRKPATAWPLFLVTFVVITIASIGLIDFDATWILLGLAGVLFVYGLVRGALSKPGGLGLQTLAMIVVGAAAGLALLVDPTVGAYVVALGLLAHAGWDAYHHRVNKVVVRSMAEFCFVLDVLLAVAIVIVTLRG